MKICRIIRDRTLRICSKSSRRIAGIVQQHFINKTTCWRIPSFFMRMLSNVLAAFCANECTLLCTSFAVYAHTILQLSSRVCCSFLCGHCRKVFDISSRNFSDSSANSFRSLRAFSSVYLRLLLCAHFLEFRLLFVVLFLTSWVLFKGFVICLLLVRSLRCVLLFVF